jgi:hypothetical protein
VVPGNNNLPREIGSGEANIEKLEENAREEEDVSMPDVWGSSSSPTFVSLGAHFGAHVFPFYTPFSLAEKTRRKRGGGEDASMPDVGVFPLHFHNHSSLVVVRGAWYAREDYRATFEAASVSLSPWSWLGCAGE